MEIDGTAYGHPPDSLGQEIIAIDAKQIIKRTLTQKGLDIFTGLCPGYVVFLCPRPVQRVGANDAAHFMPATQEDMGALNEQRSLTRQKGAEW